MKKLFLLLPVWLLLSCDPADVVDDLLENEGIGGFTVSGSISTTATKYPRETTYVVIPSVSGVTIAVGNIGTTDDVVLINLVGDGNEWAKTTLWSWRQQ